MDINESSKWAWYGSTIGSNLYLVVLSAIVCAVCIFTANSFGGVPKSFTEIVQPSNYYYLVLLVFSWVLWIVITAIQQKLIV